MESDVKLMTTPDASNRMLLCSVNPTNLLVILKSRGSVKIRFDRNIPDTTFPTCKEIDLEDRAKSLLENCHKGTEKHQQCLFDCDTNRSTDNAVIRVHCMVDEMVKRNDGSPVVVMRVFSNKAEAMVLKHSSPHCVPNGPERMSLNR